MQNKYTKILILAIIFAVSLFALNAKAQEGRGGSGPGSLKVRAETKIDNRGGKAEIRQDFKGEMKGEKRPDGISPMMIKREIKVASGTEMFRKGPNRGPNMEKKMEKGQFQVRKEALVKQLNIAIENLTNIAARLAERITKAEESGRNMTDAKASLTIAQTKLSQAKTAVNALSAYTPTVNSTTTATTTVQVDIEKARQVGDAAIKAVKDAKEALKKVIQDIAHNMGLGKTGTSTAPVIPPVTGTTTATTTATTTDTTTGTSTATTTTN
jgi:hypothetical protein